MIKLIGFYDYTVILTYLSLLSSIIGIYNASIGNITVSIICLIISGICDAFDGIVARSKPNRSKDEKSFGIQLDSLCDVISFGITPALICYYSGVNGPLGIALIFLYTLAALIRLAFFNVLELNRQKKEGGGIAKYYRGLPVTTIAIIFPVVYITKFFVSKKIYIILLHLMLLVVSFLFVLDFKVKKVDIKKLLKIK